MTFKVEGASVVPPLYIDTANQRIGINQDTPTKMLDMFTNDNNGIRIESTGRPRLLLDTDKLDTEGGGQAALQYMRNAVVKYQIIFDRGNDGDNDFSIYDGSDRIYVGTTGNVQMGGSAPNASAKLDVNSTTLGFLPPRVTTTQKGNIASPTAGLVVYDTTLSKLCVYNGSAWETVTSV